MINHRPCLATLQDVKEPTHCLKGVGHRVSGVAAGLHLSQGLGVYNGTAVIGLRCCSVPATSWRRLITVNVRV